MKEKPIIFSGEMVRAILAGTKTQTRRVVTPQPPSYIDALHGNQLRKRAPYRIDHYETGAYIGFGFEDDHGRHWKCPYGTTGDRLWVRETHSFSSCTHPLCGSVHPFEDGIDLKCWYAADNDRPTWAECNWRPSIHMPRWASRITLEVTDVRVQRVQDISEEDAQDEGVPWPNPETDVVRGKTHPTCIDVFAVLWDKINSKRGVCKTCKGTGLVSAWGGSLAGGSLEQTADDCPDCHGEDKSHSWANNPWVWVVSFRRID